MGQALPLDQMSVEEKIEAMEEIWTDLSRKSEQYPSPAWHGDVLANRAERVREGEATFSSLSDVKKRIKDKL